MYIQEKYVITRKISNYVHHIQQQLVLRLMLKGNSFVEITPTN